jgi:excisionase family DNA binding protein
MDPAMERYLKVAEVVERTRLSRSKVYDLLLRGSIPSASIDRTRRVREADLEEWMRAQVENPLSPAA